LYFVFFLEGEVFGEEIDELLRRFSREGSSDDIESYDGGLEGVESLIVEIVTLRCASWEKV
jgi:hypothetical protein